MTDPETKQHLEAAVRGIATAGKTLKLYPPTSPIPRQAVETAIAAIEAYLDLNPVLSLAVARAGLNWQGQPLAMGVPGVSDLADTLREHGVAELNVLPGCGLDELMRFLSSVVRPAEEVRREGGLGAVLAADSVECVRVTGVSLTVIEEVAPAEDQDMDEFLKELASDPDKLAAWMAAAAAGDPSAFAEGLEGLAGAAGANGLPRLMETLSQAFMRQDSEGKDAMIGLSLEEGTVRSLADGMFRHLGSMDIASSMCEGLYGKNMLSLSNVLTHLPLQQRIEQVYKDVQRTLAESEHSDKEASFLSHMMEVRTRTTPEPSLIEAQPAYLKVAEIATLAPEEIDRMREETERSRESVHAAGVQTMLTLLDQQDDFELYCRSVDSLAAMVPRLIENGDMTLARRVLMELTSREGRTVQPWPDLTMRLRQAISRAVDHRAMAAALKAVIDDPNLAHAARDMVQVAGEAAGPALIAEAVTHKEQGIAAAEEILGRRILDLLVAALPPAQWFQVGPIVQRLAREGDQRSMQAIEGVLRRPDEQSRREAAAGLAAAGGASALRLLGALVKDPSAEVSIVAIRSLGKHGTSGAAALLSAAIASCDMDGRDFALVREMIGALARMPDPEAAEVLTHLGARKALIKRGHFAEIQDLVRQAQAYRSEHGGAQ